MSAQCSGDRATCAWGSCFECDSISRVYTHFESGRIVKVKIRKGDTEGTWVYRLPDPAGVEIHACSEVDAQEQPECQYINEQASRLLATP